MSTELVVNEKASGQIEQVQLFDLAQREAMAWSKAGIVPKAYQGKISDCIVALDVAKRLGASPLQVMQNLYIVHGTPSWSSTFLIAAVNHCGRYGSLRYEERGDINSDDYGVRAWATEKGSSDRLCGSWITWKMVKAEGWLDKAGSKWKTMPEQMFRYRAAAFWQRTYAPEIGMGFSTKEEVEDIGYAEVVAERPVLLTPAQMKQAQAEIECGHTTVGEILERFPTLSAEQVEELRTVKPAEA
jgi:hypothetical protein